MLVKKPLNKNLKAIGGTCINYTFTDSDIEVGVPNSDMHFFVTIQYPREESWIA